MQSRYQAQQWVKTKVREMMFFLARIRTLRFATVFLMGLVGLLLQGCGDDSLPVGGSGVTAESGVIKSPNDQLEYRHIRLKNQLDVLLISDPTTEKSAASLDVYVGSYQNPKDREGLLHFLEHMLFLGTQAYPNPGDYQTFISEHGGNHNAMTGLENTNYFFDINSAYLEQALDRFAPFFSSPNFDAKYVDRERNAVESEYRLKIKDDGRRQWDVMQEQVDPAHPMSKFTVGNLETLADLEGRPVRDELLEVYQRYYSANLMKLVVLGRENLDQLQAMVEPRFEIIANNNVQIEPHTERLVQQQRLPLEIQVKPLKNLRQLSLDFQLPKMHAHWRLKPTQYIGGVIGYEGQGSLVQMLKDQGLIESLSAGAGLEDRSSSMFSVNIGLTPEGYAQRHKIIELLFAWIELFRQEGIQEWRFLEQVTMAEAGFRFKEKQDPINYVLSLSGMMQLYPVNDVLRASYLMEGWDKKLIQEVAAALTPDNVYIMVTAPEVETDQISARYSAEYSVAAVDDAIVTAWEKPATVPQLKVPAPNPYLPGSLELAIGPVEDQLPQLRVAQPGVRAWHLLDTSYGVPKAHVIASIGTGKTASIEGLVKAELFIDLVKDQLNAKIYPASEAGLSFSLQADERDLSIVVGGYSDKQTLLLKDILSVLTQPEWDEQRFNQLKQARLRRWSNFQREYPFRQLMSGLYSMLGGSWTPLQKVPVLEKVDMPQLQRFVSELFSQVELKILVSGNHTQQGATNFVELISDSLSLTDVSNPARVARLEVGAVEAQMPIDHDDAALVLYMQASGDTLEQRARFALLGEMLSAPFYNELRTEKQLGYVVSAFTSHLGPVPGLAMLVQSPTANEDDLRTEYLGFLAAYQQQVSELQEDDLQRYQASVLGRLEEQPKNLAEKNSRFMEALGLGYDGFDFRSQLADAIRQLSVKDLQQAYKDQLIKQPRRLWLKTADVEEINSLIDIRKQASDYAHDF